MKQCAARIYRRWSGAGLCATVFLLVLFANVRVKGQTRPYERTFPQSKDAVEKVLKEIQANLSGRLPVLDGFADAGEHPLDRYQRGYYQATIQVSPAASGGSLVRITTKVTAWYADSVPGRSGYRLLTSNGRLEADLLDQLEGHLAQLAGRVLPVPGSSSHSNSPTHPAAGGDVPILAPEPARRDSGTTFSSPLRQSLAAPENANSPVVGATAGQASPVQSSKELQAEAESLEEILKNQARPNNLVAVKKSGTPVVATPSLTAKTLFLASLHDEFEMLDFNTDWVHVRISGLSRGWIWRNSLEMPEGIPDVDAPAGSAPGPAADAIFHVTREETAPFPGDWEPLRGKNVKIISVQKTDETAKDAGLALRLEFAKSVLDKSYTELAGKTGDVAGIVLIFDSADGGMIAATLSTLQQWKAGALSDSALWHQCFFDPPEMMGSSSSTVQQ